MNSIVPRRLNPPSWSDPCGQSLPRTVPAACPLIVVPLAILGRLVLFKARYMTLGKAKDRSRSGPMVVQRIARAIYPSDVHHTAHGPFCSQAWWARSFGWADQALPRM
ncbi:hypothetical protein [uncultured Tateyamaria sp.]|uniref:hypothetical protein n=1 Tax=uncultured Tateyamaria sp. TaxID=455651 RepID=UPI00262B6C5D|nr:hypothetical protein [uncultured Tateyamaria sp.]